MTTPINGVPYVLGSLADVLTCLDSTQPEVLRQLGTVETQLRQLRLLLADQPRPVFVRAECRQNLLIHIDYLKMALNQIQHSAGREP